MNSRIYVFGNLKAGYTQYPEDYTNHIFRSFRERATAKSQIVIHREKDLVYYGYIRELDEENCYIGFCVVVNGIIFTDMERLFSIFENATSDMISRGDFIMFDDNGDVIPNTDSLNRNEKEIKRITTVVNNDISELENTVKKLPPLSFNIANDESINFSVSDNNNDIIDASAKYGYTCIFKYSDYDTVSINNYRNVIVGLNEKNSRLESDVLELQENNKKLLHKKKQYRFVFFLMLILLGAGVGLFFLNEDLERTKSNLLQTEQTVSNQEENILSLNNELSDEKNLRTKAEQDFTSLKNALDNIQPFIVGNTSFDFYTGYFTFSYYGFRNEDITLTVTAYSTYGDIFEEQTTVSVSEGEHNASVYISQDLDYNRIYTFYILSGNKIIGGGRH